MSDENVMPLFCAGVVCLICAAVIGGIADANFCRALDLESTARACINGDGQLLDRGTLRELHNIPLYVSWHAGVAQAFAAGFALSIAAAVINMFAD